MTNYINGYGNPRFLIRESLSGTLIESIDINKLVYEGLIESYEDEDIIHRTAKGTIHKIPRSTRIRFTISYADYIQKDNLLKIQRILNYEKSGKSIFLVPRSDVLSRFFEVVYSGDSFDLGLWMGGHKAPANRLPVLSWVTRNRVEANWLDPDDINIPLDDFIAI
jgi:hypothetical protein